MPLKRPSIKNATVVKYFLRFASCRGAMNALMAEILEGHVRLHLYQPDSEKDESRATAAEELIEVIKRYLK